MRINKFIAQSSMISRRKADELILSKRIKINGFPAQIGSSITETDIVLLDDKPLNSPSPKMTLMLNKPIGYVVSRNGQGSRTIYDLLPQQYHRLNPIGRLDKNSSGLLLLTNDGNLALKLSHPRYQKIKIYNIILNKDLQPIHAQLINDYGITLKDGVSKLQLTKIDDNNAKGWSVTMSEGRNRQIRRTFESLGYDVIALQRITFGNYNLNNLPLGKFKLINS